MRNYIYIAVLSFLSLATYAQTLYTTKRDSVPVTTDSITLHTNQYRGVLQWQRSYDGQTWTDLINKKQSVIKIPAKTEAFYRAKLNDGNCFETYTDSAVVLLHKVQNTTVDPKAIVGTILIKTDGTTFTYKNIGNIQVAQGTLLLQNDSASNIRVVASTTHKNDTLIIQTIQGSMADVFLNTSFNLTTASASNQQNIKGLSKTQQSKALTDENGFIHPVSVRSNNFEEQKAKSTTTQDNNIPLLSFGDNFSGEDIYNQNGVQITFTEGYYNFNSELKCEFEFEQPHFDLQNLKFNAGRLKRFSFYTDPDVTGIDAKLILLAKAGGKNEFEKEKMLKKNVLNKSFKFLVGEVPVWMDVTMDLMAKASGSISSELSVSGGASASAHASLGATYENGSWTPINTFTKTFTLYRPDITGKANEEFRVEVYPHISVKFYKLIGPWLEIAPYVSQEMNVSISGNSDFELYGGTDARLGIDVTAFDKKVANFSHEFNIKKDTLYQTPYRLKLLSGDNQTGEQITVLSNPVIFQVIDSENNPVTNYPVNFICQNGSVNKSIINSNTNGKVSINWTLGAEGEPSLKAFLKDGTDGTNESTIVTAHAKYKGIPTVRTSIISNINGTTATGGGNIIDKGDFEIIVRGICWSTTGTPTITDNKTTDGIGVGTFSSNLTRLTSGAIYYVRAYATNNIGTAYGETVNFTAGCNCGSFTDPRDGHVYKTITIGTQTWMAENLAYLPVAASDPTVGLEDEGNWWTKTTPYYYVYDLTKYGVVYNWHAANSAAPPGWHLPTETEWRILEDYLGGSSVSGGKLKSVTEWKSPNTKATNSSCFTALPGRSRDLFGDLDFGVPGYIGCWWSWSTNWVEDVGYEANAIVLDYENSYFQISNRPKFEGFCVRCVRD